MQFLPCVDGSEKLFVDLQYKETDVCDVKVCQSVLWLLKYTLLLFYNNNNDSNKILLHQCGTLIVNLCHTGFNSRHLYTLVLRAFLRIDNRMYNALMLLLAYLTVVDI